MNSYRKILVFFAIFFILALSAPQAVFSYSGRITVGSLGASPGENIAIPVYLGGNDRAFSAGSVPLRYGSSDIIPDSVSMAGSMLDATMSLTMGSNRDSLLVQVLILPPFISNLPTVTDDSGLLFTIWFTVSPSAIQQIIVIDSLNTIDTIFVSGDEVITVPRRIEFSDPTGFEQFLPVIFNPGQVSILSTSVGDEDPGAALPKTFALSQNFPNPFNPSTKIAFTLPYRQDVSLEIFNVLGQRVDMLASGTLTAGSHEVQWQAADYPSGVYFYRIRSESGSLTRKMLLLK